MMVSGIGAFATMDALIKWLTGDYPVAQVVALRSWFGLPLLALIVHFEGGMRALATRRPLAHLGRYALVLGLSFSFFWALSQMKLVDAVAISFAAPILITTLSVPLLGESVGLRRWMAICVGFIGVLIMLRPGVGVFQWAALVVLGSAVFYSLLMITTRALKSTESTASLILYPQLGMSLTGILIAPFFWTSPTLVDLGLFALAGGLGSVGILGTRQRGHLLPDAGIQAGAGCRGVALRIYRADLGDTPGLHAVGRTTGRLHIGRRPDHSGERALHHLSRDR